VGKRNNLDIMKSIGTEADPQLNGRLVMLIDEDWINSSLPLEDIYVPLDELPDQEQENGRPKETVKDIEKRWIDNGLQSLSIKKIK